MTAALYTANDASRRVHSDGLALPDAAKGYVQVTAREAELLGCSVELVDVLDVGTGYVAYSIFDYEGGSVNHPAMEALAQLSGHSFTQDEDMHLFGPVLIVTDK